MKISISSKSIVFVALIISVKNQLIPYPCVEVLSAVSALTPTEAMSIHTLYDDLKESVALERKNLQFYSYTQEHSDLEQFQSIYTRTAEILLNNSSPFFDLLTDGFLEVAEEFKKLEKFAIMDEFYDETISQKFFDWLGIMYLFISANKNNTNLTTIEHEVITLFLKACDIAENLKFMYIKNSPAQFKTPHTKIPNQSLPKTRFIEILLASGLASKTLSKLSGMVGPAFSITAMAGAIGLAVHKIESFFKDPYRERLKSIEAANKRNRQHLKEFARGEKRLIRHEAEQIQSKLDELDKRLKGSERMFEQIQQLSDEIITGKKPTFLGSARLKRLIDKVF